MSVKRSFAAACTSLMLLVGGAGAATANVEAPVPQVTAEELQVVNDFFEEHGVKAKTREQLLQKVAASIPLDSMTMPDSAAVRVKSHKSASEIETVRYFPDGSVSSVSAELPASGGGDVGVFLVTNCKTTGAPGVQTNCKVHYDSGSISMYFRADYTLAYDAYDSIQKVYSATLERAIGYAASQTAFGIVFARETSSRTAKAQLTMLFTAGQLNTFSRTLQLSVGRSAATQQVW